MYYTCTIMYYAAEYTNTCAMSHTRQTVSPTPQQAPQRVQGQGCWQKNTPRATIRAASHPILSQEQHNYSIETVPLGKRGRKGNTHRLPRWVGTPFTSEIWTTLYWPQMKPYARPTSSPISFYPLKRTFCVNVTSCLSDWHWFRNPASFAFNELTSSSRRPTCTACRHTHLTYICMYTPA